MFIHQIYTFYPKITSPLGGHGGREIYNFLSTYPTDATLVEIGPVVLEKKMLMDGGRWTTDDDGR